MCGATSYRRVIDRDTDGVLRPTGLFHCSGCSVVFADPKAWRDGEVELPNETAPGAIKRLTPVTVHAASSAASPAAPDFSTYGATPSIPASSPPSAAWPLSVPPSAT